MRYQSSLERELLARLWCALCLGLGLNLTVSQRATWIVPPEQAVIAERGAAAGDAPAVTKKREFLSYSTSNTGLCFTLGQCPLYPLHVVTDNPFVQRPYRIERRHRRRPRPMFQSASKLHSR